MGRSLTHLSLFSGIGGLDLAAEAAGFVTVGQCEWADYPTKILEKHWPDVPRWRDIRTLTGESFYERTGLRTVDVVSGGFPCQPFSVAGKRKGKDDDRYLWPEMFRVIRDLKPTWVLGENVPGILRIAGAVVAEDLEREGYDVTVFNYEAAAVGAPHRRARVFFVAYSNGTRLHMQGPELQATGFTGTGENGANGSEPRSGRLSICSRESQQETNDIVRGCKNVSNAEMRWIKREFSTGQKTRRFSRCSWWAVEPDVGRVAHGVPHRVDRLKCLGNAVVPAQAYPIFQGMYLIEMKEVQE